MPALHGHYKEVGGSWHPEVHGHPGEGAHEHAGLRGYGVPGGAWVFQVKDAQTATEVEGKTKEEEIMANQLDADALAARTGEVVTKEVARAQEVVKAPESQQSRTLVAPQDLPKDAAYYTEGAVVNKAALQAQIVQLVQKDEGMGKFRRIDTGEIFEALMITPLMVQMGRLKWPAGKFNKENKPECWSTDGIFGDARPSPDGRQAAHAGRKCITCEFYTSRVTGDREKGLCPPVHAAILYNEETGEPFIFRMSGMVNLDAQSLVGTPADLNMRRRHLTLRSKKIDGPSGSYYRLVVQRGELLSKDEQEDMRTLFESARQWELALRQEETEGSTEGQGGQASQAKRSRREEEDDDLPF